MYKTEKQIVLRLRKGEVGAYKYLFEIYYKELFFLSRKFLPNKEIAEEIVQDVFVALWENRKGINIHTSIKSYLYASVKNRSINYIKSKINTIDFVDVDDSITVPDTMPADKILELSELDGLITKAVDALPPRCKEIFHLSRNSEMTYQQIAETLEISKETVKSQISEALKRIKAYLILQWGNIPS